MALMPFLPLEFQACYTPAQKAAYHGHTHGKLALLRWLSVSGRPINSTVLNHHHPHRQPLFSTKRVTSTRAMSSPSDRGFPTQIPRLQDVVIVGGGIAGLGTALALHRLGVKPVVFEQSDQLRTAGSAIGLWTNGWKALEALGVADSLREKFVRISGMEVLREDGDVMKDLIYTEGPRDVELRALERKALLEALQEPIPDGTVFYDAQVVGIKKLDGGYTEVQCKNGRTIQTKVLIGCDGSGSVVRKYMNMREPRYVGYTITRGLAAFPDGHNLSPKGKLILGRGLRAGIAPMDANRAYWFVGFNAPDKRLSDAELVREEALNYVKGWPSIISEAIKISSLDTISRRGISDRWTCPVGGPPLYKGGVTLAGDAMHPMTPNLGQGGCCALEDAVILARTLAKALSTRDDDSLSNWNSNGGVLEMERIEFALRSYTEEQWPRMLRLAIQSYVTGAFYHLDSEFTCAVRNKLIPKLANVDRFIGHTFHDCGSLR